MLLVLLLTSVTGMVALHTSVPWVALLVVMLYYMVRLLLIVVYVTSLDIDSRLLFSLSTALIAVPTGVK